MKKTKTSKRTIRKTAGVIRGLNDDLSQSQVSQPGFTWPQFASIGQASGATGIPERILKRAKRDGCPAFPSSGRVLIGEFLPWYFSHEQTADPKEKLFVAKLKRAEFAARREKVETEEAEKSVIPIADAKRVVTRYAVGLRGKLLDMPKRLSLPMSLLKEPIEFEQKLAAEVRVILGAMFRYEWGPCECPNCKKEIE